MVKRELDCSTVLSLSVRGRTLQWLRENWTAAQYRHSLYVAVRYDG